MAPVEESGTRHVAGDRQVRRLVLLPPANMLMGSALQTETGRPGGWPGPRSRPEPVAAGCRGHSVNLHTIVLTHAPETRVDLRRTRLRGGLLAFHNHCHRFEGVREYRATSKLNCCEIACLSRIALDHDTPRDASLCDSATTVQVIDQRRLAKRMVTQDQATVAGKHTDSRNAHTSEITAYCGSSLAASRLHARHLRRSPSAESVGRVIEGFRVSERTLVDEGQIARARPGQIAIGGTCIADHSNALEHQPADTTNLAAPTG